MQRQVGQIWDELLSQDFETKDSNLELWVKHLYHDATWSYNVFRLDKIVTWIVEKAQSSKFQDRQGAKYLENKIGELMEAKVQWMDVWEQVKQRQFDPAYKYFGLHFLCQYVSCRSLVLPIGVEDGAWGCAQVFVCVRV
jgi:hypothetical protein